MKRLKQRLIPFLVCLTMAFTTAGFVACGDGEKNSGGSIVENNESSNNVSSVLQDSSEDNNSESSECSSSAEDSLQNECVHAWGEWRYLLEPTCTQGGMEARICSECEKVETEIVSKLGHTIQIIPAVNATTHSVGWTEGVECAACGDILIAPTEIPKLELTYDRESRPLVIATDVLEGNFNPFYAYSEADKNIVKQTQVYMMAVDSIGNSACGDDVPTVVCNYKETMKDAYGNETADTWQVQDGGTTEYEFIIKNGMKFSDGTPLTIEDVLFNIYVYLDPAYAGGHALSSVSIQGLQAYRLQDPMADDLAVGLDEVFETSARQRVNDLLEYLDPEDEKPILTAQIAADIATVKELFLEEVTNDWNRVAGTQSSYQEEYSFTEDWEIYYFNEGLIRVQYYQGKPQKDANGKYITNLDVEGNTLRENIEEARNDANRLAEIMDEKGCSVEEAKVYAVREYAIETVYESYMIADSSIADVVRYLETGSNLLQKLAAEERSKYYEDSKNDDGSLLVESVSGITTYKTTVDFDGIYLGEEHDVLKIVINGVDPSAIWHFNFPVAPMHYYSNAETIASTSFGVDFGNIDFFNGVLQNPEKNGLPMGAGPYKATDESDSGEVNKNNFFRNNWVYFTRNPYFETMGEAIDNAKIKYLNYRVVGSDKLLQALEAGEIDIGSPQATVSNINRIANTAHLYYKDYMANSYGYVGINPKFVPDIEVRQAIMMAMNVNSIIENYYTTDLAQVAYRSMSALSWAYPESAGEYYEFTTDKNLIREMVESAGWRLGADGIYEKNGKKLEITFTIAGESKDHPAYQMFIDARDFLNACGFDIVISTDATALRKLAMGGLAVWAAETPCGVDPDLYGRYHKNSTDSILKNWGYDVIMSDNTDQFIYEQTVINDLSEAIEEARGMLDQWDCKEIYAEALDLIIELAVELPTYQRKYLVAYNKEVINPLTLNQNANAFVGAYERIWEVDYN